MILNFMNINLINFINVFSTNEFKNNSWIFTVLWISIIFSLFLSFLFTKSPIISVLSLLLLSISVVFLWFFETQFLFIYLVYILAFIGAVLMLFLSVVLMLPISSVHNYKNKFASNRSIYLIFFSSLDFNYNLFNFGNKLSTFVVSGSFFIFLFCMASLFTLISVINYFRSLTKFDLALCYDSYETYHNQIKNDKFLGSDVLFFIIEFFVAIKLNLLVTSRTSVYDRAFPAYSLYPKEFGLLRKDSCYYGLATLKRFEFITSSLGSSNFFVRIWDCFKKYLPTGSKYLNFVLKVYNHLDFVYNLFLIRNNTNTRLQNKELNLSNLNWGHSTDRIIARTNLSGIIFNGLPPIEHFFADDFLLKCEGILPNRFFLIFNFGFFSHKFDYLTGLIYLPFTYTYFTVSAQNALPYDVHLIPTIAKFNKEILANFQCILMFFEVLFRTFASFYVFIFYVVFKTFSIKYILFNKYLNFCKFFNSKNFLNTFYGLSELTIQSILFLSVIGCIIPSLLTVLISENFIVVNSALLKYSGLSAIKFLLYEYSGLALILSTFVLLIALIGASTLTKK